MSPFAGMTVVCLASYFKGVEFLERCHAHGCQVFLIVKEKLAGEAWPHDALSGFVTVPDAAAIDEFIQAVTALARNRRIDRIVALEEYDVMHAATIREHLRIPGMGSSTARLFRDKLAMRVKAHGAGVRVPDFVHVLNHDDVRGYMETIPPPWVLKPRLDVSAIGIRKMHEPEMVWQAIDALDARPHLQERSSYYLLERFVAGAVYHVDSLVQGGEVVFAGANRYWRPPMDVAHKGGVFVTTTVERGSDEERALLAMNRALLGAMGFVRGATHAEFIRSDADGEFYFLEVAARVGGAYIAETLEAATGLNIWREWADIELCRDVVPYRLPPHVNDYGGVALALARQEWPDTSGFNDQEVVQHVRKRHHVGLVVRSPSYARVQRLLEDYVGRITRDHLAVLPPLERAE